VSTISFVRNGDFALLLEQLNKTDKQSKKTNLIPSRIMCIDDDFPGPFPWFNSIEFQKDKYLQE
jgi:hypothetical protein